MLGSWRRLVLAHCCRAAVTVAQQPAGRPLVSGAAVLWCCCLLAIGSLCGAPAEYADSLCRRPAAVAAAHEAISKSVKSRDSHFGAETPPLSPVRVRRLSESDAAVAAAGWIAAVARREMFPVLRCSVTASRGPVLGLPCSELCQAVPWCAAAPCTHTGHTWYSTARSAAHRPTPDAWSAALEFTQC